MALGHEGAGIVEVSKPAESSSKLSPDPQVSYVTNTNEPTRKLAKMSRILQSATMLAGVGCMPRVEIASSA